MGKKNFIRLFTLFLILSSLYLLLKSIPQKQLFQKKAATSQPPRGVASDLWADIEVGKRDFTEIVPYEVVPNALFKPMGVTVDRTISPGRAYIWDSGNNRILGIDLGKCYGAPRSCNADDSPCTADIIIGQPSGNDYGACNLDSSFQTYPDRPPSSASTLCGVNERTHTVLEDGTAVSMESDSEGNLYVPDAMNNRVLKYIRPFKTDVVADEVWGQPDFASNRCNLTGSTYGDYGGALPTASSLCFYSKLNGGAGVTLDSQGNLWVADGGNNRVLRFPKNQISGKIDKTADLVLGQPNFTTGGDSSAGPGLDKMDSPAAVSLDHNGRLYVADFGNQRILVFTPPIISGMSAQVFASGFTQGPTSLKVDQDPDNPVTQVLWSAENLGATIKIWNLNGTLMATLPSTNQNGGGSFGIDTEGNILLAAHTNGDGVYMIKPRGNYTYEIARGLFPPINPYQFNKISENRFAAHSWVGVTVAANQLIAGEGRLLFWNNPESLTNGQPPDGYTGTPSITEYPDRFFTQVKSDIFDRVWVTNFAEILVYQAPLTTGLLPIRKITSPIPVLGGGEISFDDKVSPIWGLVPTPDGEALWISQPDQSRVLRIRDPLTNPLIDIILGQTSLDGISCNQDRFPAHSYNLPLDVLCNPGNLSVDRKGNLYVSDNTVEARGNERLLMFSPSIFPDNPPKVIFAPKATKEFPKNPDNRGGQMFEPAFDSTNRMVAGYNPYSGYRFLDYFNDPTRINPNNLSDPTYATSDGSFKDFYGWPIAATFDKKDNLYIYDANRGKVLIYFKPFNNPPVTATPVPSITPLPTSTPTPATPIISGELTLQNIPCGVILREVKITLCPLNMAQSWDCTNSQVKIFKNPTNGIYQYEFDNLIAGKSYGINALLNISGRSTEQISNPFNQAEIVCPDSRLSNDVCKLTAPGTQNLLITGPGPLATSTPIFTLTPTPTIISSPTPVVGPNCTALKNRTTAAWNSCCNPPEYCTAIEAEKYDTAADVNKNKKVDIVDLSLVAANIYKETWCQIKLSETINPCSPNTLNFKIKFQGIDSQGPNKTLRVILKQNGVEKYRFESVAVKSDAAGVYSGNTPEITPDTYEVFIKSPVHLQKKFGSVNINSGMPTQDWSATPLLAGDVWSQPDSTYHDNKITTEDIISVLNMWTDFSVNVPPNTLQDLNGDNKITDEDIRILLVNYNLPTIYGQE